jgi:hypothetical protein
MVHPPVRATRLNLVEFTSRSFGADCSLPDDFEDLSTLASQILAFEQHYNTTGRPPDLKFTRTELHRLLSVQAPPRTSR